MSSHPVLARSMLGVMLALCVSFLCSTNRAVGADGPQPTSFQMRVIDKVTGTPLEGVAIDARGEKKLPGGLTDADGRLRIELPGAAPQLFVIWAKKDGYVPVTVEWGHRSDDGRPLPTEFDLALEPGTTIGGVIQDEEARPIKDVSVFVLVPHNGQREAGRPIVSLWDHEVKTDEQGRWHCDLVPAKLDDVWLRLSHPDFASDTMYGATPKPSLERLRDRTGVMVLRKGIAVTGRVTDADGKPIAGAKVAQGSDRWGSHFPDSTTDERGEFRFANNRAGEMILTVQANGFAADLKRIVVAKDPKPVEFILGPAKTIRGRLVDQAGQPVAGAFAAADTWRNYRSIEFRVETDADGRFHWDGAPADAVLFDFGKEGYMAIRHKSLQPSDDEQTITLIRPLRVRGTVVDAETGKPIESFTALPGIDWDNRQETFWERERVKKQTGGRFELEFGEPRTGHRVRIEADGFLPAISRAFHDEEGEATFDFRLEKGEGPRGTVVAADGQPVAGAEVVLVTPNTGVFLSNGRAPDRRDHAIATTNDDGTFRFPPENGAFSVVVLADRGYALRTKEELATDATIRLESWGRVEGTIRVGNKPGAGESMHLAMDEPVRDRSPRPYFDYNTTADREGRFAFDRVPPGKVNISRAVKLSEHATAYSHNAPLVVRPGETARAEIGGEGRPIVGRVLPPAGKTIDWSYSMNNLRAVRSLDLPRDTNPMLQALRSWAWSQTPEGRAFEKIAGHFFAVKVESDGSFRVEDVPAGTYELSIQIQEPPAGNECPVGTELLGTASHRFTVPEMPGGRSDEPLDIGTLELKLAHYVKVGEVAPAFQIEALDGKPLSLEDYRGKYVLLDFWATWCGPCLAETPHLKATNEAFGRDERFAMISLSLDRGKDAPERYVAKQGLDWAQGLLSGEFESKVTEAYGVRGIPSIWLIGPDGKVLAKDLRGEAIKEAVSRALASEH